MVLQQRFPDGLGPQDFLRHMAALQNDTTAVRHQHVVSQVLLRRFGAPNHNGGVELRVVALEYGRSRVRGVSGCGAIDDFVPAGSASAEQLWQWVETLLGAALDSAEAGTLFADLEHQRVIKDALALHFMRSPHLLISHYQSAARTWAESRAAAIKAQRHHLEQHFFDTTGLHPAGVGALEVAFDDLARQRIDEILDGWTFRSRVEQNVDRMRTWLAEYSIEVLRAASPLYISDAPVVLAAAQRTRTGLAGGLGLLDTEEILMPITPQLAVRLTADQTGYTDIDAAQVDQLNVMQLTNAYRYLYGTPSSLVEDFARQNSSAWTNPPSIAWVKDALLQLRRDRS